MTKKLYTIILLLICQSFAQETDLKKIYTDVTSAINSALLTRKGSIELSGSMFFERYNTTYKTLGEKSEQMIQIKPGGFYFIADNIAAGVLVSYSHHKTDYTWSDDVRFFTVPPGDIIYEQTNIGPAIKKYFRKERWRPYVTAAYLFHNGDQIKAGEIAIGGGMMYHVGSTLGVNLQVEYGILFPDRETIDRMDRIFVGIGLSHFIF